MRMRKRYRFAILAAIILGILVAILFAVYRASQQVPEFYVREISRPTQAQEEASDLMLQQATRLYNAGQQKGRWGQAVKADTINGWLAVDLPRNHPDLLPRGFSALRVHIGPEGMTLACQVERGGFHAVVLLKVSAYVVKDDVVGLQIHSARLGAIPWSLGRILNGITDAAQQSNVRIQWGQSGGEPVALITIPPLDGDRKKIVHIDTIQLEEGQLSIGGTTELAPK
jgi:hypothetical protein